MLVDLVREVADADGPVLVHCAAGKDRTGVGVALVLRLLGVSHDDVIADYLLTDARPRRRRRPAATRRSSSPLFRCRSTSSRPRLSRACSRSGTSIPGGVEGWFLDAGGDAETLERLRDRMLA